MSVETFVNKSFSALTLFDNSMTGKYILNHYYLLRHDEKRSFIMSRGDGFNQKPIPVNTGWVSKVHPAYAMMLSFFSEPISLSEASANIATF